MMAPLRAIVRSLTPCKLGPNILNVIIPIKKEAREPAIYPTIVLFEFLGTRALPNRSPKTEAAPSPIVAIKTPVAKIPNGKKKIGIKANIKTAGLMKSKFSLRFMVFPNKIRTLSGIK